MSENKKKPWVWFVVGLLLGTGGTAGVVVAQDCRPTVKITQAVVDAYCEGREPHVCLDPCPAIDPRPVTCPDPCPSNTANCAGPPELILVPSSKEVPPSAGTWGEEGVDWVWSEEDKVGIEVDWSVVTAPDFEQAIASFAFRWKEGQAWRPTISASWTEGATFSSDYIAEYCSAKTGGQIAWDYNDYCSTTTTTTELDNDWRVLFGVAGTFGK